MIGEKAPCYQCERRQVGCKSDCPDWAAWKQDHDERNKKIKANKQKEWMVGSIFVEQAHREKKLRFGNPMKRNEV